MTKIIRMKYGLAVGAAILAWGTAFGAAESFNVRAFGAKGDGIAKDTAAIQKALDACAGKGGRVVVPSGTYLTGTIWLKDRTELHLEKDAVLLGSPDLADYNAEDAFEQNWRSPGEGWSGKHLVIAHEVTDVAITGEGAIDGNGARFLDANIPPDPVRKTRMAYRLGYSNLKDRKTMARPGQEVAFYECRGVRIEGVTLRNMAMWTCFLHGCDDVAIKGVTIRNDLRFANTDGFDVDACRRVTITDCDVETADDAFAIRCCPRLLKSKRGVCEDIRIDNCKVRTECEVVRIGVGDGLVRNVRISNLDVRDAGRGFVVQSIYPGSKYKGLGIEDVVISDCNLRKVVQAIAVTAGTPNAQSPLRDVTFERVSANLEGGVMVNGLGRTRPTNIRLKDVRLRAVKGDFVLGHDWEVGKMDNDPRNVIRIERADGVTLEGVTVENGEGVERPRLATRDVTGLVDGGADVREKVVVVPAHPDDLISAIGFCLLAKDRFEVHVVDFTHGERGLGPAGFKDGSTKEIRRKEEESVCAALGAKLHWLDEIDGEAYACRATCERLSALLKELRPRAVLAHWPVDIHGDHMMAGSAALKAVFLSGTSPEVYFFEEEYQSKCFTPDVCVDITDVLERKYEIARLYKCQYGDGIEERHRASDKCNGMHTAALAFGSAEGFRSLMPPLQGQGKTIFQELPPSPRAKLEFQGVR